MPIKKKKSCFFLSKGTIEFFKPNPQSWFISQCSCIIRKPPCHSRLRGWQDHADDFCPPRKIAAHGTNPLTLLKKVFLLTISPTISASGPNSFKSLISLWPSSLPKYQWRVFRICSTYLENYVHRISSFWPAPKFKGKVWGATDRSPQQRRLVTAGMLSLGSRVAVAMVTMSHHHVEKDTLIPAAGIITNAFREADARQVIVLFCLNFFWTRMCGRSEPNLAIPNSTADSASCRRAWNALLWDISCQEDGSL